MSKPQMELFDALQKQLDGLREMADQTDKMSRKLSRERAQIEKDLKITRAIVALNEVLKESGVSSRKRQICSSAKDGLFEVLKRRA